MQIRTVSRVSRQSRSMVRTARSRRTPEAKRPLRGRSVWPPSPRPPPHGSRGGANRPVRHDGPRSPTVCPDEHSDSRPDPWSELRFDPRPRRHRAACLGAGGVARQVLPPRGDVRRDGCHVCPVLGGRRAGRAGAGRRRRVEPQRRPEGGRRLRLARLPARGAARPALRLPGARALRPRRPGSGATRPSCCWTPTPRRSTARSTGTPRCSPTTSRTRRPSTTTTASGTPCSRWS